MHLLLTNDDGFHSPLCARPATMEGAAAAWQVEGTPADCTRLGLRALAQEPVDLVISGINDGWNLGLLTYVSGTVAAAREAAFLEYPALAVSAGVDTPEETIRFLAEIGRASCRERVCKQV